MAYNTTADEDEYILESRRSDPRDLPDWVEKLIVIIERLDGEIERQKSIISDMQNEIASLGGYGYGDVERLNSIISDMQNEIASLGGCG